MGTQGLNLGLWAVSLMVAISPAPSLPSFLFAERFTAFHQGLRLVLVQEAWVAFRTVTVAKPNLQETLWEILKLNSRSQIAASRLYGLSVSS